MDADCGRRSTPTPLLRPAHAQLGQRRAESLRAAQVPLRQTAPHRRAPTGGRAIARWSRFRGELRRAQDEKVREDVLDWFTLRLPPGMSQEDQSEALAEARAKIARLPVGTPQREIEKARDRVIAEYKDEQGRKDAKERLIEAGLAEIYVQRLERDWEFDQSTWSLTEDLKPAIREALEEEPTRRTFAEPGSGWKSTRSSASRSRRRSCGG